MGESSFVIFKPLGYCFEETIEFYVKVSFAGRPESLLIRWYNKRTFYKRLFSSTGPFMDWKLQIVIWIWTSCSYTIPIFEASIQSYKKRNKKNVYKNVSSHALKPHMKLLSFTFATPESDASVLGYLKEERMILIDF